MKKITSLIVSGMLMLSMVGCGNTNQFENTTVQEQQVENPDMDRARELANQAIGNKYNMAIGQAFIERGDTLEWMFVSDRDTMIKMLFNSNAGFDDFEHLEREIIRDYERILRIYEMNDIDVKLIVNMKSFPKDVTYFSIDENGNIYDNFDNNTIHDSNIFEK